MTVDDNDAGPRRADFFPPQLLWGMFVPIGDELHAGDHAVAIHAAEFGRSCGWTFQGFVAP